MHVFDEPSANPPRRPANAAGRVGTWAARVGLAAWLAVVWVGGSAMMVDHLAALPPPRDHDGLATAIAATRAVDQPPRALALHVLYAACGCSGVIVDELLQRDVAASVAEQRLVWVEDDPQRPLRPDVIRAAQAAGYAVDVLSPRALAARYGAIAAPLLVIADERGRVRYVGGYGARKRDGQPRDRELLAAVARGDELTALPILGCATSRELQRQLDPLGLKYRSSP